MEKRRSDGAVNNNTRLEVEKLAPVLADLLIGSPSEVTAWRHHHNVPKKKLRSWMFGADSATFFAGTRSRNDYRRKFAETTGAIAYDSKELWVPWVGRIEPLKFQHLAIEALAKVDDKLNVRLIIVGGASGSEGDAYRNEIEQTASRLQVKVTFIAPQPHSLLADLYRGSDAFVVPSPRKPLSCAD